MKKAWALTIVLLMLFTSISFIALIMPTIVQTNPTVTIRPESNTCLDNRTGTAVVLTSDAKTSFTLYRVLAYTPSGVDNNVTVFKLTKDGKTEITLPYKIDLIPGEELALGFLVYNPDATKFVMVIDNNKTAEIDVLCNLNRDG